MAEGRGAVGGRRRGILDEATGSGKLEDGASVKQRIGSCGSHAGTWSSHAGDCSSHVMESEAAARPPESLAGCRWQSLARSPASNRERARTEPAPRRA